jgi:molybdopterin-guanine dinucleotide biosynthesis protein A
MTFSAVILAGGRSTRMGTDKALLPIAGQTLLAHQLNTVRTLAPAELFISTRDPRLYDGFNARLVTDRWPDAGPLAGIAAALETATSPLLLVLAVDLPAVTPELLRCLLEYAQPHAGVVPRIQGQLEPLAAAYPKAATALALNLLHAGQRAVHTFVDQCQASGLVVVPELGPELAPCFTNWNMPADLPQPIPPAPRQQRP